ncbi:hypothetical protein QR680_016847 [Steinernema hermaphroditum]|uniref:Protein kinase domain-containing protein n=1 Tax=Steinernema hermaphroditum TaxID=289476 RepID=A0AA39HDK2_9BILA|nr:hypothetical protein QR680_016847 [Steinernema hermaphroditum]
MSFRRQIKAFQVHDDGKQTATSITISDERLHANGVFSNVYSAKLIAPHQMPIAIKKCWKQRNSNEGGPLHPIIAEIQMLSQLNHPSVIRLLYHFTLNVDQEDVHCMVLDFLPTDLLKLRRERKRFDDLDAKLYAFQMYCALDYIHYMGICHRDLKPSNLIVDDAKGLLKLADFGSAKVLNPNEVNPSYQVTRYYRAPELIFGSTAYTLTIDLWAAACIVSELFSGKVLLSGRNADNQARLIIDLLGYPSEEQIKEMKVKRPRYLRKKGRGVESFFTNEGLPKASFDIVSKSLVYEPYLRLSATRALGHHLFDDLRKTPRLHRRNGNPLPPLDYSIFEQVTQRD